MDGRQSTEFSHPWPTVHHLLNHITANIHFTEENQIQAWSLIRTENQSQETTNQSVFYAALPGALGGIAELNLNQSINDISESINCQIEVVLI
jgi:hypothetical protein